MHCVCSVCSEAHCQSVPLRLRLPSALASLSLQEQPPGEPVFPVHSPVSLWLWGPPWHNNTFLDPMVQNKGMLCKSKTNTSAHSESRCWTVVLFFSTSFAKALGEPVYTCRSFIKKNSDFMKEQMKKSINAHNKWAISYRVINKTLKGSFPMWLYVVCPHWVKAIYLCPFLTLAISLSILFGLQIKEGSLWTKHGRALIELWSPAVGQTALCAQAG